MLTLIDDIAEILAGASLLPVHVSAPVPGAEALFLWPWRIDFDEAVRNRVPPARGPAQAPSAVPLRIQLLLVAQQADPKRALATLVDCGRALDANPIVRADGMRARIVFDRLPTADLCAVFEAAGIVMQPCLSYSLTITESN